MNKNGFTLAEVLITLGIIGVVAAMTLPALITKYENKRNVEQLKKFYSTFSQALQKAAYDAGCDYSISCYYESIGVTNNSNTQDRVNKAFESISRQLTNVKKCDKPTGNGFHLGQCTDYKLNHNYDGSGTEEDYFYNIITTDGMYISYTASGSTTNGGWTSVDVNGPKKPNREGRDIFTFWNYKGNKILPPVDNDNCTNENKYGQSCAARIMKNNWEIDY